MWRVILKKSVCALVIVFPLIGSPNSWANPFAWPKDIDFYSVADLLNQELKGCQPLDVALIESYFNTTMDEATASLKGQASTEATKAKSQALGSLHQALDSAVLAYNTNPSEQSAVREAFNKKLAELTEQAIKRVQKIAAVKAAQQNYKLKKVSKENVIKGKIGPCNLELGSVELTSGENKQATLARVAWTSDEMNELIKKVAFDTLHLFDPSLAIVNIYGYYAEQVENFSTFYLACESADYYDFATYKNSPESANILKNKKEVLRNLLALGKALLFAHEHQIYHQRIQLDAVWTSKDWSTWKLFYMPGLDQVSSMASIGSGGQDARFVAPEMSALEKSDDYFKADIFAFTILIELMMLDDNDPLRIAWNKIQNRFLLVAISNGATPFTGYRFSTNGKPDLTIAEPHSTLPKTFRDQLAVFAATDPDKRGSLTDLVQVLEKAHNTWDTLTQKN